MKKFPKVKGAEVSLAPSLAAPPPRSGRFFPLFPSSIVRGRGEPPTDPPATVRSRIPSKDDPRPQAWYTRHPDPPWGVYCIDCGVLASGLDKTDALLAADAHAWEVHQVRQPFRGAL